MQLLNVFTSELWPFALLGLIGAVVFFIAAAKASGSGSYRTDRAGNKIPEGNMPIYKLWHFWVAVVCLAVAFGFILFSY